uniref:Uncharacterized protein n=1 Tax=Anguilla anguilla TaxID=7936 RepID=A0A0E9VS59_ANGAN
MARVCNVCHFHHFTSDAGPFCYTNGSRLNRPARAV